MYNVTTMQTAEPNFSGGSPNCAALYTHYLPSSFSYSTYFACFLCSLCFDFFLTQYYLTQTAAKSKYLSRYSA